MRYFRKITGERVYLSPINPDDAETYTKWLNDPDVGNLWGTYNKSYNLEVTREDLERRSKAYNFAIVRSEDDKLLGHIDLHDFYWINRLAWLGIFIGEPEHRGKGYGSEAIGLILSYGFDTLNLHSVTLSVRADNERAIACYQKAGF
ncbi:MAG: GNAT family N-acetyltransferase, partial [Oscillospiraceae bacterium]|nr:GNAT family N-acetyltransferase [Oscillospiraceae bacterium]